MTDTPDLDALDDAAVDDARSSLTVYLVADSPDGAVLSHRAGYPDDDTPVWIEGHGSDDSPTPMGDLYAQYGDGLIAYAEPEERAVTAAPDPKRTADGEVVINPDAPPDPKLALSPAQQEALAAIPARVQAAEAKGDTDEVAALERYADALRAGRSIDEARDAGWPAKPAVAAALAAPEVVGAITASLALAVDDPTADTESERQALIAYAVENGWTQEQATEMVDTGVIRTPDGTLFSVVRPADADRTGLPDDVIEMLDYEDQRLAAEDAAAPIPTPLNADGTVGTPIDPTVIERAFENIEGLLGMAEDKLGITAAINGPGIIPRPTMRMAAGDNPDAQAQVLAAFEANYRDDVTEFVEDVIGPRPDPDTPEHDAEAWDAVAAEARLWHAQQTGRNVTAALAAAADDTSAITADIGDLVADALAPDA